jgi:hypothetical protein
VRFTYDGHTSVIRFREAPSVRSRVVEDWCVGDVLGYLDLDLGDAVLASIDDDAPVGDVKLSFDANGELVRIQILDELPAPLVELAERL